jgi:hypothetical protein
MGKKIYKHKFILTKSDTKNIHRITVVPISTSCQGWAATVLRDIEERILSLSLGWGKLEDHSFDPSWLAILTLQTIPTRS